MSAMVLSFSLGQANEHFEYINSYRTIQVFAWKKEHGFQKVKAHKQILGSNPTSGAKQQQQQQLLFLANLGL